MSKYAVIYICTGRYSILWKDFYVSAEKFFLTGAQKEYFVFTDEKNIIQDKKERVHSFYAGKMGWPYDSMLRWDRICFIQDLLMGYDYVVFCNANMEFLKEIPSEIFESTDFSLWSATKDADLPDQMPLERRQESKAYVPYGTDINQYVSGRFILGKTKQMLEMAQILRNWTEEDLRNGITPVWHDESMENAYFYHFGSKFTIQYVGPEFAAIEELLKEGENTSAIFRDKDRYGGNLGMRYNMTLGKLDILRRRIMGKLRIG